MNIKGHLLKILLLFVLVGSVANADIRVIPIYKINGNSVYYRTENGLEKLQNADAKTFEILGYHIAKDKNYVYYESDNNLYKIENADLKTFEILDSSYTGYGNFSKDKNYIYLNNKKLEGIDVKTFEKMQANLIRDKNDIYKVEENEGKHGFKIVPINARIDFKKLRLGIF